MATSFDASDPLYFELDQRDQPAIVATPLPKSPKALGRECGPQYIPRRCVITHDEASLSLDELKTRYLLGQLASQQILQKK